MSRDYRRSARGPSSLFVRNVPFDVRKSQLEHIFARYGEIRDVYIPLDYYTREPRGFAYIEFIDDRDAKRAIKELDGLKIWRTSLQIEWAKSDRKTPKEMREQTKRFRDSRHYSFYNRPRNRIRSRYCKFILYILCVYYIFV